ncbi:MAG TPA: Rieske (2Fe-2S) protein [Gemmatimonadaceae bacterium]|nr:Rieske (2Fe-2S) protein [Gemmatimonadaceae bacterium]
MAPSPQNEAGEPEYERVCAARDVPPGRMLHVTLRDGTSACVGNHDGAYFAVRDRCPHQQYPLSDGELTVEGTIVCSWHGATYDCMSGRAVRGPVRDGGLREAPLGRVHVYHVRVADGGVHVRIPDAEVTF